MNVMNEESLAFDSKNMRVS